MTPEEEREMYVVRRLNMLYQIKHLDNMNPNACPNDYIDTEIEKMQAEIKLINRIDKTND